MAPRPARVPEEPGVRVSDAVFARLLLKLETPGDREASATRTVHELSALNGELVGRIKEVVAELRIAQGTISELQGKLTAVSSRSIDLLLLEQQAAASAAALKQKREMGEKMLGMAGKILLAAGVSPLAASGAPAPPIDVVEVPGTPGIYADLAAVLGACSEMLPPIVDRTGDLILPALYALVSRCTAEERAQLLALAPTDALTRLLHAAKTAAPPSPPSPEGS